MYVRNFGAESKWIPGFISGVGGIMFDVSLSDGKTIRRHIDHIRSRVEEVETNVNVPPVGLPFEPPPPSSVHPSIESSVEPTESTDPPIVERPDPPIVEHPIIGRPDRPIVAIKSPIKTFQSRYPKRDHRPPDRFTPTV